MKSEPKNTSSTQEAEPNNKTQIQAPDQDLKTQSDTIFNILKNSGCHKISIFANLEKLSLKIETSEGYDALKDIPEEKLQNFKDS